MVEFTEKELEVIDDFIYHSCSYDDIGIFDGNCFDSEDEALDYYNTYVSVCKKLKKDDYIKDYKIQHDKINDLYYIS